MGGQAPLPFFEHLHYLQCSTIRQLPDPFLPWQLASSSDGSWNLKLGGFSLAIVVTEPLSLVCGTTYYMAPEMLMETGWASYTHTK